MKPIQSGIGPKQNTKAGTEWANMRRDIRSLAPRYVPGAFVSHTSEGVRFRPKATATEGSSSSANVIPRWG